MRRSASAICGASPVGIVPALGLAAAFFFLGGLAGCILAASISGDGGVGLTYYMNGFLDAARTEGLSAPAVLSLLWQTLRWPLLAVLLGFTALGLLGLPLLFAVRGFLLAFSIASFVRMFGGAGCLLAFLVFGITGAISVPVLFVLGVQSLLAARNLASSFLGEGKRASIYGRVYFLRCGVCAAVLGVCVLLEYLVIPTLVSGLAGTLMIT